MNQLWLYEEKLFVKQMQKTVMQVPWILHVVSITRYDFYSINDVSQGISSLGSGKTNNLV